MRHPRPVNAPVNRRSSRSAGAAACVGALAATILAASGCGAATTAPRTTGERAASASSTTAVVAAASTPAAASSSTPATTSATHTTPAHPPRSQTAVRSIGPPRPRIVWDPIPFGPRRKAETTAYVRRHYGSFMRPTWRLIHPHVIVIHYTEASYSSTFNTFASDVPDVELHELPGTCAHFVIDANGTIHQLVSLGTICRHTVGLNWTAIGIEHVGFSDAQVLSDHSQMTSSLRLVRWLRCRYHIPIRDVIGHNESLSSPYHHEDVAALRAQTHSDFNHADMQTYRHRLRQVGGCA